MFIGLLSGVFWGLDTVILGIALAAAPFVSTEQAVFLAPFVSTFLHDACSSLWMLLYMGIKKQYKKVIQALKTSSGKWIVLGALLGGPIGMSGYVAAIRFIGPAYTAIISSIFPALGALFSYVFLKEKMKSVQIGGLLVSILGVIVLGYQPGAGEMEHPGMGFLCAMLCCISWAAEAVICAYGMKESQINNEEALQIRQLTSAVFYGMVILTVLKGWKFTLAVLPTASTAGILIAALFGTASYVYYYKAIAVIGPSKAMALNITYSAWAIVFSILLLHMLPDRKSIVCGIVIVAGSLLAAANPGEIFGFLRKRNKG